MTTKLTAPLRREIEMDGESYTVTVTPLGVRISRKRFRQGRTISWKALWHSGEPEHVDDEAAS